MNLVGKVTLGIQHDGVILLLATTRILFAFPFVFKIDIPCEV